jgi:hypothetical protein
MAVIMQAYCTQPSIMRAGYFRLVNFFFGSGEASWANTPDLLPSPSSNNIQLQKVDPAQSPSSSPQYQLSQHH